MGESRYNNSPIIKNIAAEYNDFFDKRGVPYITQISFDKFKEMKISDTPGVQFEKHQWTSSDRFYKMAHQYYGDPTYWWVIAFWNHLPLESDVKLGQTLIVPMPIERILKAIGTSING